MSKSRTVIVGGGVIGLACAHFLNRLGQAVTIIDRGTIGGGCSHGNCGLVVPSHVLPLAEPGAAWDGLKSLFNRRAALRVSPRFDVRLWKWMWQFTRRCNTRHMVESGRAIQPLLTSSRAMYDALMASEPLDCEWQARGLLFVFRDQREMDAYAKTNEFLTDVFNAPATRYDATRLNELEPALNTGLAGGWHYPGDAHLRPDKLMSSWRKLLESRGVEIREHCEFTGLQTDGGNCSAVKTSAGDLPATHLVMTLGAWSPLHEKTLGCKLPVLPGKGYSITMPRPAVCPRIPLIFPQHHVAVTPMETGFRLGSIMEFAGYDQSLKESRLELLKDAATVYLKAPGTSTIDEKWYGWRPMTYDSTPIIGRAPAFQNVWLATGHNMLGLSMAPATGKLISELVTGEKPHINPEPYTVERF